MFHQAFSPIELPFSSYSRVCTFPLDAPHLPQSSLIKPPKTPVLTSASTVTFKNESDGKDVELDVRGTWYDRSASVTFSGERTSRAACSI